MFVCLNGLFSDAPVTRRLGVKDICIRHVIVCNIYPAYKRDWSDSFSYINLLKF